MLARGELERDLGVRLHDQRRLVATALVGRHVRQDGAEADRAHLAGFGVQLAEAIQQVDVDVLGVQVHAQHVQHGADAGDRAAAEHEHQRGGDEQDGRRRPPEQPRRGQRPVEHGERHADQRDEHPAEQSARARQRRQVLHLARRPAGHQQRAGQRTQGRAHQPEHAAAARQQGEHHQQHPDLLGRADHVLDGVLPEQVAAQCLVGVVDRDLQDRAAAEHRERKPRRHDQPAAGQRCGVREVLGRARAVAHCGSPEMARAAAPARSGSRPRSAARATST